MAKKWKKLLSLLLVLSMTLSLLGVSAFADEADGDGGDAGAVETGPVETGPAEGGKDTPPGTSEPAKTGPEPNAPSASDAEIDEGDIPMADITTEEFPGAEENAIMPAAAKRSITVKYFYNLPGSVSSTTPDETDSGYNTTGVTIKDFPSDLIPGGYIFSGWNQSKTGTSVAWNPGKVCKQTVSLYAQWETPVTEEEAVAQIGDTYYRTLAKAVSAAQTGDTIVMTKDITGHVSVSGKSFTLDMDGHTISYSGDSSALQISNGANVTITGNGTITGEGNAYGIYNEGSTLTLENGTVSGSGHRYGLYAMGTSSYAATTVINGGTISGPTGVLVGLQGATSKTASLTINGGTVIGVGGDTDSAGDPVKDYGVSVDARSSTKKPTCTINGGTIIGPDVGIGSESVYMGTVVINGGAISGSSYSALVRVYGSITIKDGYFAGEVGTEGKTSMGTAKDPVITGGYFTQDVSNFVAKGYHCTRWSQSHEGTTYSYKVVEHTPGEVQVENCTEPTCEENGYYDNVVRCTLCNDIVSSERVTLPATGHSFTYANNGDGTHTATCSVCDKQETAEHTYGDWTVTVEPTCLAKGSHYKTCICEDVVTEEIPALGHDFPAAGEGEVTTEPTCTEKGVMTYTCKNGCGWTMTSPIDALGHDYVEVEETPATCTETGLTAGVVCSRCGDVQSGREEIPMLATVAMIGEERFPSVSAAVQAAQDGDTIVLMADTAEQVTIGGKTLTLDLNGHKLSSFYNETAVYPSWLVPLAVTNKADVTITGEGEISNNESGKAVTVSDAKLTVNGGKISADNNVRTTAIGISVSGGSNTVVTINGGEVYGKAYAIDNTSSYGTVNVNGGTVYGGGNYGTIRADRLATVNVNGGTVRAEGSGNALTTKPASGNVGGGKINVTGGTVEGGVYVYGKNSVVTISGGEISGVSGVSMNSGTVQISGGTISGTSRSVSAASTACVVTVTGGWFNGEMGYISSGMRGQPAKGTPMASDKINVTGGHFTSNVAIYVPDSHHCAPCEELKDGVTYNYVVGEHTYTCQTNGDGTHKYVCTGCGGIDPAHPEAEEHTLDKNNKCEQCGAKVFTLRVKISSSSILSNNNHSYKGDGYVVDYVIRNEAGEEVLKGQASKAYGSGTAYPVLGTLELPVGTYTTEITPVAGSFEANGVYNDQTTFTTAKTTFVIDEKTSARNKLTAAELTAKYVDARVTYLYPDGSVISTDYYYKTNSYHYKVADGPAKEGDTFVYWVDSTGRQVKAGALSPILQTNEDGTKYVTLTAVYQSDLIDWTLTVDEGSIAALDGMVYDGLHHKAAVTVAANGTTVENVETNTVTSYNGMDLLVNADYHWEHDLNTTRTFAQAAGQYTVTFALYVDGQKAAESQPYSFTIAPAPLTVVTDSAKKIHDGEALTAGGHLEGLLSADEGEPIFTVTGTQTEIGSSQNTYKLEWKSQTGAGGLHTSKYNYTITEDLGTLTVNYTVTVAINGGEPITVEAGETLGQYLPEEDPTREGYTFIGWFNGEEQVTAETAVTEDMTVEAKWEINTYTVTVGDETITVNHGESLGEKMPAAPSRSGYAFAGWFTEENGGEQITAGTPIVGNVSLYAHWTYVGSPSRPTQPDRPTTPEQPDQPGGTEIEEPDTPLAGTPVDTIFADVAKDSWYVDAVQYVFDKGLMTGTSSTVFSPDIDVSRGMIVTIFHRMENKPKADTFGFDDVPSGEYYSSAVDWAALRGIVAGYGNGKFGPEDTMTREQLVAVLYRYAKMKGYDVTARADLSAFTDAGSITAYAAEAMSWANATGLLMGTSKTTLSPTAFLTRAQVATILMRFDCNVVTKMDAVV